MYSIVYIPVNSENISLKDYNYVKYCLYEFAHRLTSKVVLVIEDYSFFEDGEVSCRHTQTINERNALPLKYIWRRIKQCNCNLDASQSCCFQYPKISSLTWRSRLFYNFKSDVVAPRPIPYRSYSSYSCSVVSEISSSFLCIFCLWSQNTRCLNYLRKNVHKKFLQLFSNLI